MNPTVKVFTAGDHFGGLDRGSQAGEAEDFIQQLLIRSGYTKAYNWECRIDKQKHCSGGSRPVRVVGFKSYGVFLRVKPGVHDTVDYQMTLYIPQGSGYSAKNLFDQLRANEKSISRVIRQQEKEEKKVEVTAPPLFRLELTPVENPAPVGTAVAIEEYRPEFRTLQAIIKNPDKLKYVLEKIKTVIGFNFCRNRVQFAETFKHECKWDKEGHSKVAVGRLLTELVKSDYIMETVNEKDKIIGYTLTEKGDFYITKHKDDKPTTPPSPPVRKEEKFDIPALLIGMREKLQELADVANKIAANNLQKSEYAQKMEQIDKENGELSKILYQNKESHDLLNKLGQLITPLPVHGARHNN